MLDWTELRERENMINANVSIAGIIMCCDESLRNLTLGRGYVIEKCNLDTLFLRIR